MNCDCHYFEVAQRKRIKKTSYAYPIFADGVSREVDAHAEGRMKLLFERYPAGLDAQHTSTDVHIMLKGLQSSTKQDIEFFSKNNRSQQVYHCKSLTLICQSLTS